MSEAVKEIRLFASVRRLLATALEMAQVRLDLLSTEVELEKRRLFDGLLFAALALLALAVALLFLCAFVILLSGEAHRLAAVGGLTLFFALLGAFLIRAARQRLRSPGGMFAASLDELKRDRAGLRAPDQHETP
jgi:uncharacterized membrane protein YqjE